MISPLRTGKAFIRYLLTDPLLEPDTPANEEDYPLTPATSRIPATNGAIETAEPEVQQPVLMKKAVLLAATKFLLESAHSPEQGTEQNSQQPDTRHQSNSVHSQTSPQLAERDLPRPPVKSPELRSLQRSSILTPPDEEAPLSSSPAPKAAPGLPESPVAMKTVNNIAPRYSDNSGSPHPPATAVSESPTETEDSQSRARVITDSDKMPQKLIRLQEQAPPQPQPFRAKTSLPHSEAVEAYNDKVITSRQDEPQALIKERRENSSSQRPREWTELMDHIQQEEAKLGDVRHKTRKQRAQESTETSGKQDVEYYPFPSASPPEKSTLPSTMIHLPILAAFTFLGITILFLVLN